MVCIFHKWNGCICQKCGAKRNAEHDYKWEPGKRQIIRKGIKSLDEWEEGCQQVCRKCGMINSRAFREHVFKNELCTPTCIYCGRKKSPVHQYEHVEGKCIWRCNVCGEEIERPHLMRGQVADGVCRQVCERCGYTVPGHSWYSVTYYDPRVRRLLDGNGCTCKTCGATNPEGRHKWKTIQEGGFANIKVCQYCGKRDESEKITMEEARRRDEEYHEAMVRADSLSEMRSVGIKC